MKQSVYFLTMLDHICERKRTVGWFNTFNVAEYTITKDSDSYDLNECRYDYAVIEKIPNGVYGLVLKDGYQSWWYKWDGIKYYPIDIPENVKNWAGIGIG